jgi:serine/threonine protein kinase/formylglycine-generating enzyme required for sulfatase activity
LPQHIGRYRVEKILGQGGFGLVYLAFDEQLQRLVAVKVPHPHLISSPQDADAYLAEARTAAGLDHPHIVPVFDVGGTANLPCFIVSKFIEGRTLAGALRHDRPAPTAAAALVATIAEALQHAHQQGVVHRDIKPSNILLDRADRPFVADFGLALRDQDVGHGPRYPGTPAYMSPEQARGEGHRVEGRTDVFSLGVVFYELLTGRRPFHADSRDELLEQIATQEPRPPRQWDSAVPKELERICLKALARRAADRFTTAQDLADDLRHFLAGQPVAPAPVAVGAVAGTPPGMLALATPTPTAAGVPRSDPISPTALPSDGPALKVIPRGLRSFDAHDADFFLELVPGPRDRDGLPDSIRFWKTRIEETDPDNTFAVGLIYGPSGCGKSSLVKAGLLPRLSDDVIAVHVEATAQETETRLLNGLRKRCLALPAQLGLKEALAALRLGQGIPPGQKVLIVLDQFEQWLHARKEENTELVQALRQCDGGRVQCVLMVRDDFWMATTRFLRELEIDLVPGRSIAAADLFDRRHAKKVLTAFGRAFGTLPESAGDLDRKQAAFVEQAVSGLAQEGKVICVRLALFAEMMKGKPWAPSTLKEVGGAEGTGIAFLEETFSSATANPKHRLHQKAARAVLEALLPEAGSDIKGHMRSYADLLAASGYSNRPRDFDDLLRILDSEIRLLTPTDPEGRTEDGPTSISVLAGAKYYQLTHDYLVPSLRDWLTRKQKETMRGRAELLLADRVSVWNTRRENRQLPSPWQWLSIRWLTRKKTWTPPQRKMMRAAGRYHAARGLTLAVCLALLGWGAYEAHGTLQAHAYRDRLLDANTADVPAVVAELATNRRWLDPLLREAEQDAGVKHDGRKHLHVSLALLPVDPGQVNYLYERLLDAQPHAVPVLRDALAPHQAELLNRLWLAVEKPEKGKEQKRMRAAAALAAYDPDSARWGQAAGPVAQDLVADNPVFLGIWTEACRPVKQRLLPALSDIFRDRRPDRSAERTLATNLLADYAADQPQVLADLLMDTDEKQFAVLFPRLQAGGDRGLPVLQQEVDKKLPAGLPSSDEKREKLAKRQANAAVALLRMNRPERVWPLLRHSPDPRVRSYLIHRLAPLGADAESLIVRFREEKDVSIRRALLLCLGEYSQQRTSVSGPAPSSNGRGSEFIGELLKIYASDPDPGLHAAAEWLLRTWKQEAALKRVNDEGAQDNEQWGKRLGGIKQLLTKDQAKTPPQWYVNGQGQTMVVIPGPVEFVMGSPPTEDGRNAAREVQHKRRIGRTFAIAAKAVTVEQYRKFQPRYGTGEIERFARTGDSPVILTDWLQAAAYCNWLSKQEGLPENQWCFEPVHDAKALSALAASSAGLLAGSDGPLQALRPLFEWRYAPGIRLAPDYLQRCGYRLPTEAEMEYATRAGAQTARYYGETEDLLPNYAWYIKNAQGRTWPVASLKPNDFGLFDVHGNAFTWCQESFKAYPSGKSGLPNDDIEDLVSASTALRVLRGGAFTDPPPLVRSAYRYPNAPAYRSFGVGLRPARTFPP